MPIHWFWIVALLVVVLIVFGPGRLPELGGAVGKAMREFRKATSELTNEVTNAAQATPPPPAAPQPAPPAVETSTATGSQSEAKS
ncbi:MAG TPA: twin-arginine translocase TatA/TatE family subunit [Candidatus Acidoferrum sp.]|jgi:sec-independent protein translocase protein TatA|nr:twin-arginine translocase TatA/TatE family subunit [Candidatus Acidoferrum sp.]